MRLEFADSTPTIRQNPLLLAARLAVRHHVFRSPFTVLRAACCVLRAACCVLRAKPIQDFQILRIDDREKTFVARELP